MPVLCLAVSDPALRQAIAEQARLADLAELQEAETPEALKGAPADAILFDWPAEKKTAAVLREFLQRAPGKKPALFLIGTADESLPPDSIAEVFPLPLRLGYLLARLQFHLQLMQRPKSAPLAFGPFRLDPQTRQVDIEGGSSVRLTEKEAGLLSYLFQSDKPVAREELLAAVWGYDERIDTHTLETHIYRLRRKLDPQGAGLAIVVSEQGMYSLARG